MIMMHIFFIKWDLFSLLVKVLYVNFNLYPSFLSSYVPKLSRIDFTPVSVSWLMIKFFWTRSVDYGYCISEFPTLAHSSFLRHESALPIFVLTKCIPSWFVGKIILNVRGSFEQWDTHGCHLLCICVFVRCYAWNWPYDW